MTPLKSRILNEIQGEIELARANPHKMNDHLLEVVKIANNYNSLFEKDVEPNIKKNL